MSLDKHVAICDLPPPAQYGDGEKFRQSLAAEICRNPTLAPDPRGKATRDGRQTRHLRQPDAVAIEALIEQIKHAAQDYARRLSASDEPFAAAQPKLVRLVAWAVVCGKDGRQKSPSASSRLAERRLLRHGVPTGRCESLSRTADPGCASTRTRTASNRPGGTREIEAGAGAGSCCSPPICRTPRSRAGRRRTHQRRFRCSAGKTEWTDYVAAPRSAASGKSCVIVVASSHDAAAIRAALLLRSQNPPPSVDATFAEEHRRRPARLLDEACRALLGLQAR